MKLSQKNISYRGFSLIEIMITLGVLAIGAFALLELQTSNQKYMVSSRQASSRDSIKMMADRYSLDTKVISESAKNSNYTALGTVIGATSVAGNEALDYCLNGPPLAATPLCPISVYPNCCQTVNNVATPQPFHIIDPVDNSHKTQFSGTDAASGPLTPTPFMPVRYNINGMICTTPSSDCALELVSGFLAECPGMAPNCQKADKVFITYSLRGANGITPTSGVSYKPVSPSTPILFVDAAASSTTSILYLKTYVSTTYNLFNPTLCVSSPPPNCPVGGWIDLGVNLEANTTDSNAMPRIYGQCVRTCIK